jgi:hypothetical protein
VILATRTNSTKPSYLLGKVEGEDVGLERRGRAEKEVKCYHVSCLHFLFASFVFELLYSFCDWGRTTHDPKGRVARGRGEKERERERMREEE